MAFFGGDQETALTDFRRALKPGGIVGIVEVAAGGPGWDSDAHRLGKEAVVAAFTGAGFELVAESDMLANPDDDHSRAAFDTGRHLVDRYLLKLRRAP